MRVKLIIPGFSLIPSSRFSSAFFPVTEATYRHEMKAVNRHGSSCHTIHNIKFEIYPEFKNPHHYESYRIKEYAGF